MGCSRLGAMIAQAAKRLVFLAVIALPLLSPVKAFALTATATAPLTTLQANDFGFLQGSASGGTGLTYQWTQTAGPTVELAGDREQSPSFYAPWVDYGSASVTLTFEFTVTDYNSATASDSVSITVTPRSKSTNSIPSIASLSPYQQQLQLGSCAVFMTSRDGYSYGSVAEVSLHQSSGAVTYAGGNSYFSSRIEPGSAMSSNDLAICLQTSVLNIFNFRQNGADASYTTDTYMGFSFDLVSSGATKHYEFAMTPTGAITSSSDFVEAKPVANAGQAQSVVSGATVTLDGTLSSDANNWHTVSYKWTAPEGIALSDATGGKPTFTAPTLASDDNPRELTFSLVVNDGIQDSDPASVTVTVEPPVNTKPTATIHSVTNPVSGGAGSITGGFTASAIIPPATYTWTTPSNVTNVQGADSNQISFTAPVLEPGSANLTLQFSLVVNAGYEDSDPVPANVTVYAPPRAIAGENQTIDSGVQFTLSGSASGGYGRYFYLWGSPSGDWPSSQEPSVANPTLTAPTLSAGAADKILKYELTVTDENGVYDTDTVEITVKAPQHTSIPTAYDVQPGGAVTVPLGETFAIALPSKTYVRSQICEEDPWNPGHQTCKPDYFSCRLYEASTNDFQIRLNAESGVISGTASSVGSRTVTARYLDTNCADDTFTLNVISDEPVAPAVTGISPNAGPAGGGTAVTITGTGFTDATKVSFGGADVSAANFTSISDAQIEVNAPAGSAGKVDVTVTTPSGASDTSGAADDFTYTTPAIAILTDANVELVSGNTILQDEVPAGTQVTQTFKIKNTGNVAVDLFAQRANLPSTFNPNISETNNSLPSSLRPGESGELTISYKPRAAGQFTYVLNIFAIDADNQQASFALKAIGVATAPVPAVTSVNPAFGPAAGGTEVTITGTGFTDAINVSFGSADVSAASFTSLSDTQIVMNAPAGSAGKVDVAVTTAGGTSDASGSADDFTYSAPPVVDAGQDQTVESGAQVTLTAVGSGGTASYEYSWKRSNGEGTTTSATTASTIFAASTLPFGTADEVTEYEVTIVDADGLMSTDKVQVTVQASKIQPQTITFADLEDIENFVPDQPVALQATASSNLIVSFASTTQDICTVEGATATIITAGTCTITADQAGDANYAAAEQTSQSFTIGKASQTITFISEPPSNAVIGDTYEVGAKGGASGNPVTFSIDEASAPVCTISDDGLVSATGPGTCKILAAQAGDQSYLAAESNQSFAVGKIETSIALQSSTDAPKQGEPVTFTATVTQTHPVARLTLRTLAAPVSGPSSGTVSFFDGAATLCSDVPLSDGQAVCATSFRSAGQRNIVAVYSGDNTMASARSLAIVSTVDNTVAETQTIISRFMINRMRNIQGTQPDVLGLLNGRHGGGPNGSLAFNGEPGSFNFSGAISLTRLMRGEAGEDIRRQLNRAGSTDRSANLVGRMGMADAGADNGLESLDALDDSVSGTSVLGDSTFGMVTDTVNAQAGTGSQVDWKNKFDPRRFDLWIEGQGRRSSTGTTDSSLWVGTIGFHYFVNPNLIVGVMTQFDHASDKDAGEAGAAGNGWTVGPYAAGRIAGTALEWEARAAWGASSNKVSPYGTYEDDFDTSRFIASGKIGGHFDLNDLTVAPWLRASYMRETQHAYVDSLSNMIPGQTVELGEMEFGTSVSKQIVLENDTVLTPRVGLSGIWTFTETNGAASSDLNMQGDLRAQASAGFDLSFANGFLLSLDGLYDGIGASDYEAVGGKARIAKRF